MVHPDNAIGVGNGNPLQYSCLKILQTEVLGGLYSLWDHKQSDMTKHTHTHAHTHTAIFISSKKKCAVSHEKTWGKLKNTSLIERNQSEIATSF